MNLSHLFNYLINALALSILQLAFSLNPNWIIRCWQVDRSLHLTLHPLMLLSKVPCLRQTNAKKCAVDSELVDGRAHHQHQSIARWYHVVYHDCYWVGEMDSELMMQYLEELLLCLSTDCLWGSCAAAIHSDDASPVSGCLSSFP